MTDISFLFEHNLVYLPVTLSHEGKTLVFQRCIIDTGSAGTTFEASLAEKIGLLPAPESKIRFLVSVGGKESVYTRTVEEIRMGEEKLKGKYVEFGDLETKFHIDGIIGNDLLQLFLLKICYKEHLLSLQRY